MSLKRLAILCAIILAVLAAVVITNNMSQKNDNVAIFRKSFMTTCNDSGEQTAYCICSFDSLLKSYGLSGFMKMAVQYSKDEIITDQMYDSIADCIGEYKVEE